MYLSQSFDYSVLNGKITEKFGTKYNFAKKLNLSERSISLKINGKIGWKQIEIANTMKLLDLPLDMIPEYFFKPKVQFN